MKIRARTGTTHGNCSGSYVTYFQRDEVKRAGARGNSRAGLATLSKTFYADLFESKFNKLQHPYKTMECLQSFFITFINPGIFEYFAEYFSDFLLQDLFKDLCRARKVKI